MSSLKTYQSLKKDIGKPEDVKSNILVLSLPTMGAGHLAKQYIEDFPKVKYINGPNQSLGDRLSVIYLAYDIDPDALTWVDNYVRSASLNQKFIIFLNSPDIIDTEKYHHSYLAGHVYQTIWLKAVGNSDAVSIAKSYCPDLTENQLTQITTLSGGLPQIIKYLSLNTSLLTMSVSEVLNDPGLKKIMEPLVAVVSRCSVATLDKIDIMSVGQISGELLKTAITNLGGIKDKIDVVISFDLSVEEAGKKTGEQVSVQEKQIIEDMIIGGGNITKEKVSDIKWGEGKYDEFSDQAINKTMRRLDAKLKHYQIETIPKVGYRITPRTSGQN